METVSILLIVALGLFAASATLLIHHWIEHGQDGQRLDGTDRCFQLSDVGNFHSCNHEMWIVVFVFTALALVLAASVLSSHPR